MATNLDLDDKLIEAARRLGGHKTKRDAVTRALEEYVRWLRQQAIVSEFGKIDYDPNSTTRSNAEWRESSCRYGGPVAHSPTPRPVSRRCSRR